MALTDIYALPAFVRIDIETALAYPDTTAEIVMEIINKTYKGQINFDIQDLKQYIKIIKKKKDVVLSSPISMSEIQSAVGQVDYKNRPAIMEYFRKKVLERMAKIESNMGDRKNVILEVEAILIQYMKVASDIIEKEERLKMNFQESDKFNIYMKEQIDKLLIILRGVIKNNVGPEKYKLLKAKLEETLKLYKF